MHILTEQYHPFNLEKWGLQGPALLETETMFRYYAARFNLSDKDLEDCDTQARKRAGQEIKKCDDPFKGIMRVIAMAKMIALVDRICQKHHLSFTDFTIEITGVWYSFDVFLQYKGKNVEDIKEDVLTI